MNPTVNPFPDTILTPSSAHRIPVSLGQELIDQLVPHGVNAAGFLMDDDLLTAAHFKGFANDYERARKDLKNQLPDAVREEFFPTPKPPPSVMRAVTIPDSTGSDDDDDDDDGSGMGSGLSIGMGSPGVESPAAKRRREEREGRSQRM